MARKKKKKCIIKLKNVYKEYNIYKTGLSKIKGALFNSHTGAVKVALRNINLEVYEGDRIALMGDLGSGRSTLIRILSDITYPTRGKADIRRSVTPMIDLRVGFDGELTGRENIYTKAAVLCIPKQLMKEKEEEVIDFSGMREQIDFPIKTWRMGLPGRLGFAVFTVLEPEILLIDDPIVVGDGYFRTKCMNKIEEMVPEDGAMIMVTNIGPTIRRRCNRVLILDDGELVFDGEVDEGIKTFREIQKTKNKKKWQEGMRDEDSEEEEEEENRY